MDFEINTIIYFKTASHFKYILHLNNHSKLLYTRIFLMKFFLDYLLYINAFIFNIKDLLENVYNWCITLNAKSSRQFGILAISKET